MSSTRMHDSHDDIAIVGMAGRFPGAGNLERYWQNLRAGVSSISFFPEEELKSAGVDPALLDNPNYVKAGAVLEHVDLFDAPFFGFTRRESELMDPQQRAFLECAWETLEEGGYDPETCPGRIGVYAGQSLNSYMLSVYSHLDVTDSAALFQMLIGNEKDHLPMRVSYKLNLKGPSINVQTACSTSLVAVVLACQGLLDYHCDMALAGGVSIRVPSKRGYLFQEGGILSPDGLCRAFDARAQGTVSGDGVGVVLLKRLPDALADGDNIHAVIKGTAINNDGSAKVGYTAPSIDAQAEVIAEALAVADIEPETIAYVEAHGTGTPLGDPIEIAALTRAFGRHTEKKGFCAVGSVKSNIGHLDAAAGVAGLIKAVLALKHGMLPPSLNFSEPNPHINFADSPFYVNTKLREWVAGSTPRRASVSSFGIGGTNAHVVLEEAAPTVAAASLRSAHLLVLSAKTPSALATASNNLAAYLRNGPTLDLADVAYTLQVGRRAFGQRRAHVCTNLTNAIAALETSGNQGRPLPDALTTRATGLPEPDGPGVVMMFPGQGAQQVNMARGIYESETVFRDLVDQCAQLLKGPLGLDLRRVLFPDPARVDWAEEQLNQTSITQPALFVVEYALAKLWIEWGVRPVAMIGHSIGEYVAACLAGVVSLEDALGVVTARGRLMQSLPMGAMLAVSLSEDETVVRMKRHRRLSLAAHNGFAAQVVSGPLLAVASLQRELNNAGVCCRRLRTSHAFHSTMMEPMKKAFATHLKGVRLNAPSIPYISNVTGKWITPSEPTKPDYWVKHLRQSVRFAEGIAELLNANGRIMLEVGPGRTLSSLVKACAQGATQHLVLNSLAEQRDHSDAVPPDLSSLLNSLGQLWAAGVPIDWAAFHRGERRRRVSLPTYPFERQRYWIEPRPGNGARIEPPVITPEQQRQAADAGLAQRSSEPAQVEKATAPAASASDYLVPADPLEESIAAIWQEVLGLERVSMHDNFFELGGNSLIGLQLMSRLRKTFLMELPISVLFEAPTVPGLAANIADSQRRADEMKEIERTLRSIEGLSDAEVHAILLHDSAPEHK